MKLLRGALFAAVAGGLMALSSAAQAQGRFSWTGFYLGGHAGYAWGDQNWTSDCPGCTPALQPITNPLDGVVGGGHLGAQYQFSNVVIGAEISLTGGKNFDDRQTILQDGFDRTFETHVGPIFLAQAKLGLAFDRFLPYIKGGFASADVDFHKVRQIDRALQSVSGKRESGWTIGGGFDYAFAPRGFLGAADMVFGIDYNFIKLDGSDRLNSNVPPFIQHSDRATETDIHMVTARLTFLFGPAPARAAPLK